MMRALWTASSGMRAQQLNLDTISNNLANVNTTGFKKCRVDFQDLLYETVQSGNRQTPNGNQIPTTLQIGHGVAPVAVKRIFAPGNLQETGNTSDFAINGEGFFQVELPDGNVAYTRDGSFYVDFEDEAVYTSDGLLVLGAEVDAETKEVTFELAKFKNPGGLESIGGNLFKETAASGEPETGEAGSEGFGSVKQGFLEMSNVQVVEEMVNMIVAQRAYETNTKTVQAADEMLAMANSLRR